MKKLRRGMTTLEISVVVALIGLFASMAVVNMDGVSRKQRERSALREISIHALQARSHARTSPYAVRLAVLPNPAGFGTVMRWEQLACNERLGGRWGNARYCPMQQCLTNECGKGGCECVSVGEYVPIPNTLDVSSLNWLCWRGQGAAARQVQGGRGCVFDALPPQQPYRINQKATGKVDHVMQVDGLTGKARMVDCTTKPLNPLCPT